jgi:hypothetical protein
MKPPEGGPGAFGDAPRTDKLGHPLDSALSISPQLSGVFATKKGGAK